jgi:hypothetical protein
MLMHLDKSFYAMYLFRPVIFAFAEETDEFIPSEEQKLRQAIENVILCR